MRVADQTDRQPAATSYQERLRAIGQRLDCGGWHDLCLLEDEAVLVVSAIRGATPHAGHEVLTLRLSQPLVRRVRAEARRWRGRHPATREPASQLSRAGYQARLRAVGWLCDERGLRQVCLAEDGDDLLLAGRREAEASDRPMALYRLTPTEIRALLRHLARLRHAAP